MYARFDFNKIYRKSEWEVIMRPQDKRNDRPRRFAVCKDEFDAGAVCSALNLAYNMPQPTGGRVAEYWERS